MRPAQYRRPHPKPRPPPPARLSPPRARAHEGAPRLRVGSTTRTLSPIRAVTLVHAGKRVTRRPPRDKTETGKGAGRGMQRRAHRGCMLPAACCLVPPWRHPVTCNSPTLNDPTSRGRCERVGRAVAGARKPAQPLAQARAKALFMTAIFTDKPERPKGHRESRVWSPLAVNVIG